MRMHDGIDIGPRLEDLAVQVALAVHPPAARIDRLAVGDAEFEHVLGSHERGRHGAGQQEAGWVLGRAHADMAEAVEHGLVHQDPIGRDQTFDHVRI